MRIADIKKGDTCPNGWTRRYNKSYCTGGSAAGCHSAYFSTNSTGMIKCVGRQWDIRRDLWMAFTHMPMHMEMLMLISQ